MHDLKPLETKEEPVIVYQGFGDTNIDQRFDILLLGRT